MSFLELQLAFILEQIELKTKQLQQQKQQNFLQLYSKV